MGRMIRALQHANILNKTFTPIYEALNSYRKNEGNAQCPYNIHTELNQIEKTMLSMGKLIERRKSIIKTRKQNRRSTRRLSRKF
jgi:hypothetical protein